MYVSAHEVNVADEGRFGESRTVPDPRRLLHVDYVEDDCWYFVGKPSRSQGWKLYVPATTENYCALINVLVGAIHALGVSFKYLRSTHLVGRLNAGLCGYSQIGKCIVIYAGNGAVVPDLVRVLKEVIDRLQHVGPMVPRLPSAWQGARVFYRYGSYVSRSVTIDGKETCDDRNKPFDANVRGIEDPFVCLGAHAPADGPSLAAFPIVGEFYRSGKGGVFVALDLSEDDPTEVVVKIGLRYGQVLNDGRDAYDLCSHESIMYDRMEDKGFAHMIPAKIATIADENYCCLVTRLIGASNMAEGWQQGSLGLSAVTDALNMIQTLNRAGFIVGDAKLSNFVHDGSRCWLIDLESMRITTDICANYPVGPATFRFEDVSPHSSNFDEVHFLISCLYVAKVDVPGKSSSRLSMTVRSFIDCYTEELLSDLESFALGKLRTLMS